jgi:hypothetical protein
VGLFLFRGLTIRRCSYPYLGVFHSSQLAAAVHPVSGTCTLHLSLTMLQLPPPLPLLLPLPLVQFCHMLLVLVWGPAVASRGIFGPTAV